MMSAPSFDGQLTKANVGLAVRSGIITEEEGARYWKARYRHTCLSDTNSSKTIASRTAEFQAIRELILQKMKTSRDDILGTTTTAKLRLEEDPLKKEAELSRIAQTSEAHAREVQGRGAGSCGGERGRRCRPPPFRRCPSTVTPEA